jgi:hypothetical protein
VRTRKQRATVWADLFRALAAFGAVGARFNGSHLVVTYPYDERTHLTTILGGRVADMAEHIAKRWHPAGAAS